MEEVDLERLLEHIEETNFCRRLLREVPEEWKTIIGPLQGDDATVVEVNGERLVINMEGPYPAKIGRKTAIVHSAADVVVTGGEPIIAFDAVQAESEEQAEEILEDLRKQAEGLGIKILGGNTQSHPDLVPCVSVTVIGRLVTDEPIPDGTAREGDTLVFLGEPVRGDVGDRVYKAKVKFNAFLRFLREGIDVSAAKDASRGGILGNLLEMMGKSKKGVELRSMPYPTWTGYLGIFMVCIDPDDVERAAEISFEEGCPFTVAGEVVSEPVIRFGNRELVSEEEMIEVYRRLPYKPPGAGR
ncbi:AIR synthase related protein [Methanopyrus sp.]